MKLASSWKVMLAPRTSCLGVARTLTESLNSLCVLKSAQYQTLSWILTSLDHFKDNRDNAGIVIKVTLDSSCSMDSSRSVGNVMIKQNSACSRMMLLLTLLNLLWHGYGKSLGSVSAAAKLKWNRHLSSPELKPSRFPSMGGTLKDNIYQVNSSTIAALVGCPRGAMVKAMDCGIVVSEFVLQSCYYVHFRANTLGKGMNPLILPAMGQIAHYCSSRRMALALNNLQRLIYH